MIKYLFQDWDYNGHDIKIRFVLVAFRFAQHLARQNKMLKILAIPYFVLYKIIVYWLFHMELHWDLVVGVGLRIFHGYCLVIHPDTKIGDYVTLRHCVTIGNDGKNSGAPIIMNKVNVGSNAVIIGAVTIGDNAVIGAGAVVTKNAEQSAVVVGNPAKDISKRNV